MIDEEDTKSDGENYLGCQWPCHESWLCSIPLGTLASFGYSWVLTTTWASSDVLSGIVLELHQAFAAVHARLAVDDVAVDALSLRGLTLCCAIELADQRRLAFVSHGCRVKNEKCGR